jgi:hypothetical protein
LAVFSLHCLTPPAITLVVAVVKLDGRADELRAPDDELRRRATIVLRPAIEECRSRRARRSARATTAAGRSSAVVARVKEFLRASSLTSARSSDIGARSKLLVQKA